MSNTPDSQPSPEARPTPPPPRRRKRRLVRWAIRIVVGVPLLLTIAVVLLMRSPLVGQAITTTVFNLTGGEWHARRAIIAPNGQLIINDLTLRAPGIAGPAGEVLSAPQAIADIDWSGLPVVRWFFSTSSYAASGGSGSGPRVTAIRLTKPTFRLSQSVDDESLNIGAFTPPAPTGKPSEEVPRLDVVDGRVEFTEYSERTGGYTVLNTLPVNGSFVPAAVGPLAKPVYVLRLQEIGRVAPVVPIDGATSGDSALDRRTLIIDGRIDLTTDDAAIRLYNLSLDAWPADSVPRFMRDIWRRLNMMGRVAQASFRYSRDTGVDANIVVEDISMAALIPAKRPQDPDAFFKLSRVNGQIALSTSGLHADLTGLVEDQTTPSRVTLDTYGTDLNSPLRCEISGKHINISRDPAFLPYVPDTVRQYLDWFGGPTADVDAKVVITRGDPINGEAAPFNVPEGKLEFRDGTTAFHKFPYPFHNCSGEVNFDDHSIHILRIKGDGPTGAKMSASGLIAPLDDESQVDLVIGVTGAPVDTQMLDAMQPGYRRMLEVLFCREKYEQLLAAGLLRAPGDNDPAHASAPAFEFGGKADVGIKVGCPFGRNTPWYTEIDVDFTEAGLVPEPFAYPIAAKDVHLHINDKEAYFTRGQFAGLRGGKAELSARVGFGDQASDPMQPEVRITATDIPVDDLLLHAVPGDDQQSDGDATPSANAILRKLSLEGLVDCRISIDPADPHKRTPRPEAVGPVLIPDVEWALTVELDKLMAMPKPDAGDTTNRNALCLRNLSGSLHVSSDEVRIDPLIAQIGRMNGVTPGASMAGSTPAGELRIALAVDLLSADLRPDAAAPQLAASIGVKGLDLADPIEHAIAVFDSAAAKTLSDLSAARRPTGAIDADIAMSAFADGSQSVSVALLHANSLSLQVLEGTLAIDELYGRMNLKTPSRDLVGKRESTVDLHDVSARLSLDGDVAGSVAVTGRLALGEGKVMPTNLSCSLRDWRFESGLVRSLAIEAAGRDSLADFEALGLKGSFDSNVELSASPGESGLRASGWLEPRSLGFSLRGSPYQFSGVAGRVIFDTSKDAAHGRVENASVSADHWRANGEASWSFDRTSGLNLAADLNATSEGLPDSLVAILPHGAREAVAGVSLKLTGPSALTDGKLTLTQPPNGETNAGFSGDLRFADVEADFGLKLDHAAGSARVAIFPEPNPTSAQLTLNLDTARLDSVSFTDASAEFRWTSQGVMVAENMLAKLHGGRVCAGVRTEPNALDAKRKDVVVGLAVAGVQFAPLRAELAAAGVTKDQVGPPEPDPTASVNAEPISVSMPDTSRGLLDARLDLRFVSGDISSRRGTGAVRITSGDVLNMPLVMSLVRLSNLMLPFGDRSSTLESKFYINGPVAVFNDVNVRSDAVAIVGGGTITWPNLDLDMSFNSRSTRRIPLWSDLFEAMRNEIITTRVSGTVATPVVRSESLTGTRHMIDEVVNPRSMRPTTEVMPVEMVSPVFSPVDPDGK